MGVCVCARHGKSVKFTFILHRVPRDDVLAAGNENKMIMLLSLITENFSYSKFNINIMEFGMCAIAQHTHTRTARRRVDEQICSLQMSDVTVVVGVRCECVTDISDTI